jgi:pimeloyl-ACP methyl ester carboxylesterase
MRFLISIFLLAAQLHSAEFKGLYRQKGGDDCWYIFPKGKLHILSAGWGRFVMEPAGPNAFKVKDWPDSTFTFETPEKLVETKNKDPKPFKTFELDQALSAELLKPLSATASVNGVWKSQIKAALFLKFDVFLHLDPGAKGTLDAKLDLPKAGLLRQALPGADYEAGTLSLALGGLFVGCMSGDGKEIQGRMIAGGKAEPFVFKRSNEAPELKRPQEPKAPFPYEIQEVSYRNPKAGVTLAGTLTQPKGPGPFPAVLLLTGSGPQNRDEELMGHKPFWILADYLTRQGLAVLRVDDRGVGGSTAGSSPGTTRDFAGDALAGLDFLAAQKKIAKGKCGLIGHSEGAEIATIAAASSKKPAFIVLLAGPGLPGEEILYSQSRAMGRLDAKESRLLWCRRAAAKLCAFIQENPRLGDAELKKSLQGLLDSESKAYWDGLQKKPGKPDDVDRYFELLLSMSSNAWGRFFFTYDPRMDLAKVSCPVLALNGEKDQQVPCKENTAELRKALELGKNRDYSVQELPGLNHLFQKCKSGSPMEYGEIEETFSPQALEPLGAWLKSHAL